MWFCVLSVFFSSTQQNWRSYIAKLPRRVPSRSKSWPPRRRGPLSGPCLFTRKPNMWPKWWSAARTTSSAASSTTVSWWTHTFPLVVRCFMLTLIHTTPVASRSDSSAEPSDPRGGKQPRPICGGLHHWKTERISSLRTSPGELSLLLVTPHPHCDHCFVSMQTSGGNCPVFFIAHYNWPVFLQ